MADSDHRRHSLDEDAGPIMGGMAPVLVCWGLAQLLIPNFATLLVSFGTELPWATRFILHYYDFAFLLALLVVVAWWIWPREESRGLAALVFGVVLAAVLWCAGIYSLYMPIFQLGAIVG